MGALLAAALGLMALACVGVAALGWRLSQGPLELPWLAHAVEAAANGGGPARLSVGGAALAWNGFRGGAGQPVELRLTGLRVANPAGEVLAELARAEVSLSIDGLLAGEIAPRVVELDGARLRAERAADGALRVDLGGLAAGGAALGSVSLPQILAELGRPRGADPEIAGIRLRDLRRVQVRDLRLEVLDRPLGVTWRMPAAQINLERPEAGGLSGTASAAVALGGVTGQVQARAATAADGAVRVEAELSPVSPSALAGQAPALAPLAAVDAAVGLAGTLDLSPGLAPLRATLRASAGEGSVRVGGSPAALRSAAAEAVAAWDGAALRELRLVRAEAVLSSPGSGQPTTLRASGAARLDGGRVRTDAEFEFDRAAFADLDRFWPVGLARNARGWLVENLTAGTARGARLALTLEGPADLSALDVTAVTGELQGDDVTIHWLRPIPPVEHVQAVARFVGPDVIELDAAGGRQGAIRVPEGHVRLTGLANGHEAADIAIDVAGGVADVLALLRHPRLHLLDRQRIELRDSGGTVAGRVALRFPLVADLRADQLDVHATARTSGLRLAGIAAGRGLERGAMQLDVTQDGLKANGQAVMGGIPGQLAVDLDFRAGPPDEVLMRVEATGQATARQLGAAGLDASWIMDRGQVGLDVAYAARRDDRQELRVRMDLRAAALSGLGWSKAPGVGGWASARLTIEGDHLTGIEEIRAEAPGLSVRGRSDVAGGQPSLLLLDRLALGRTRAAGEVLLPARRGGAVRATVSGEVLDLSAQLARQTDSARVDAPGTPWTADVVFDRVLLEGDRFLVHVTGHAESDGRHIRSARIETGGREQVRASIVPRAGGRQVSVRAADAGALLQAFGVGGVFDGRLNLDARYDDGRAEPLLAGTAELTAFGVREAEVVGKVLQAMTLYGLVDALRGPGLFFDRLVMPFRFAGDVLELRNARAFSASLGVTAQGRLDLARQTVDIEGTIVPAYVINSALGRLPLVGRLFSPEQGGGVVSMTYALRGKLADPGVAVNPLSVLTPGVLRRLFDLFG